jgi:putative molybdopterin biosynthesis protein
MAEELFDVKQLQQRLRVSERTVFNLIKRGDLKGFKAGREWRFTLEDIQEYEKKQRQKAETERTTPKSHAA